MAREIEQALLDSLNSIDSGQGERALGALAQLVDLAQRMEVRHLQERLSNAFFLKHTDLGIRAHPELYAHFRHMREKYPEGWEDEMTFAIGGTD